MGRDGVHRDGGHRYRLRLSGWCVEGMRPYELTSVRRQRRHAVRLPADADTDVLSTTFGDGEVVVEVEVGDRAIINEIHNGS